MSGTLPLLLLLLAAGIARGDAGSRPHRDGPHSCGGVEIPYPFGIGDGYHRAGFHVTCDGGHPGLATIGGDEKPVPIGNLSIKTAELTVRLPVVWQCYSSSGEKNGSAYSMNLQFNHGGVYRISNAKNYLFVLGCATVGFLHSKPRSSTGDSSTTQYAQLTGCVCYCDDPHSAVNGACAGVGCCHAEVPPDLIDNYVEFQDSVVANGAATVSFAPCDYAFVAEKDYTFNTSDLNMDLHLTPRLMPVRLDWAIRDWPSCEAARNKEGYACISSNSRCLNSTNGPGYICTCRNGYEGNPYKLGGCTDVNECEDHDHHPCKGVCRNKQGSYECTCPKNTHSADPSRQPCKPNVRPQTWIAIGATAVFVLVVLIIGILIFRWMLKKEKIKMEEHFEQNGGHILAKLNNIKLFTKEDLKNIQKPNNVIGSGCFGKVYKGRLKDSNQLVAVKEPINGSSADKEQFVNEISIQSQVNHKNIVKLEGCCLQVDVPILVYEYVPNGSLHDILHSGIKKPLSLGLRLEIAAESAEGLAYIHSKTNRNIMHGDVKPANILLNDKFRPKISDFGISRLIVKDMQHTVIGDLSYVDPIYLQTGQLTTKSDVYSFGVVLLELITRKKASHSDKNSLLKNFMDTYTKYKSVSMLLDKELVELDDPEFLDSLTVMINQCVNLDVSQRPEMTDIAERLGDMVKRYHSK